MSPQEKQTAFAKIKKKFLDCLAHFMDPHQEDKLAALAAAERILKSEGLEWTDLREATANLDDGGPAGGFFDLFGGLLDMDYDTLIDIAKAEAKVFLSEENVVHAVVKVRGTTQTLPIARKGITDSQFADWLISRFRKQEGRMPAQADLRYAIRGLQADARYPDDETAPVKEAVHFRVAEHNGSIYLDLCDEQGRAAQVNASGWHVLAESPVRFKRTNSMAPLPVPERGGSIDLLRDLINLDDAQFSLYVALATHAMVPGRPHAIGAFVGVAGSTKSTQVSVLVQSIDPRFMIGNSPQSVIRGLPKESRSLTAATANRYCLPFDNNSRLTAEMSDRLCMLATGASFGGRRLYTDQEEDMVGGARPVLLTSTRNLITKADLADRGVMINVPAEFPPGKKRRTEKDFWAQFYRDRPKILGVLLDLVVHALERQQRITDWDGLSRMADFHQWGIAVETAFTEAGTFERAYMASKADAIETVVDAEPFVAGVVAFVERLVEATHDRKAAKGKPKLAPEFGGAEPAEGRLWGDGTTLTVGKLYELVTKHNKKPLKRGGTEVRLALDPHWPKPTRSGHAFNDAETILHRKGIMIEKGGEHGRKRTRFCTIKLIERPGATYTEAERAAVAAGDNVVLWKPKATG